MKIDWAGHIYTGFGDNFGYSYHSNKVKKEMGRIGVAWDASAPVALHWVPPHFFKPIPGKFNVLYSMFEAWPVPDDFQWAFKAADLVLVPSQWCADQLTNLGVNAIAAPLGVDHEAYTYRHHAHDDGDCLHFLYNGAPNIRKGYDVVADAFSAAFTTVDPVSLIIKTTTNGKPCYGDSGHGRIFFDTRPYSQDALVSLYQQAHCFVLPSRGEGFGATAAEAMACGALVLAPMTTGLAEFIGPETAFVLPTEPQQAKFGCEVWVETPTLNGLVIAMREALERYNHTEGLRRAGSELIHKKFTLAQTARVITQILKGIEK